MKRPLEYKTNVCRIFLSLSSDGTQLNLKLVLWPSPLCFCLQVCWVIEVPCAGLAFPSRASLLLLLLLSWYYCCCCGFSSPPTCFSSPLERTQFLAQDIPWLIMSERLSVRFTASCLCGVNVKVLYAKTQELHWQKAPTGQKERLEENGAEWKRAKAVWVNVWWTAVKSLKLRCVPCGIISSEHQCFCF